MSLDDPSGQIKPDAGSFRIFYFWLPAAEKALKYFVIVFPGDSDALILYLDPEERSHPRRPNGDRSPARTVFHRIVKKIEQRLAQPLPVMPDH